MPEHADAAPGLSRRSFLGLALSTGLASAARWSSSAWSDVPRRWRIGFANITEDPAERLEGLGFTGREVRESFVYAERGLPVEMVFFDNDRNRVKAVANATEAVRQELDLYIQYCADETANDEIGRQLKAAGIPVVAINYGVPGAPLYTADNSLAGRIAGDALTKFALDTWPDQHMVAVIIGNIANKSGRAVERAEGVAAALKEGLPSVEQARLDSAGNPGKAEGCCAASPANKLERRFLSLPLTTRRHSPPKPRSTRSRGAPTPSSSATAVTVQCTAASTIKRKSTRKTGVASCSGRWPTSSTDMATMSCHWH